jgi:hypothetical protein
MADLKQAPESCNYIEMLFVDPNTKEFRDSQTDEFKSDLDAYDINVSEEFFNTCLSRVKSQHLKYFQKSFKTYVCNDLVLENYDHKEHKVFCKKVLSVNTEHHINKGIITLYVQKEKHPFHAFPSTTSIHSVFYTNRLVLRVNNRLYINFDVQYFPEDKMIVRKVFLNYNHDSNVDLESACSAIQTAISYLVEK